MMNTIELLHAALQHAESLGYGLRHEWLGGTTGGACEVAGRKWLFVDISLSPSEQFEQVCDALCQDPAVHTVAAPVELRTFLEGRRAA